MNCDELRELLPDLMDGTLLATEQAQAEEALAECPQCQEELALARQVRTLLIQLQQEYAGLRVPAGFETRLLARIRQQNALGEVLDLSSKTFALWLVEFINVIGGLINPTPINKSQASNG